MPLEIVVAGKGKRRKVRQFAALPWRRGTDGIHVLMVTSRGRGRRRMLPKGHAIEGKNGWESAQQEAFEEAGVTGAVGSKVLGSYGYDKESDNSRRDVTLYPLRVTDELDRWPEQDERDRTWVKLSDAPKLAGRKSLRRTLSEIEPKQLER